MNDPEPIEVKKVEEVSVKSIAAALASAQANMGKALKSAVNPHFKVKYADLSSVMDACLPSLNEAGIAVIQPTTDEGGDMFVETILIHGESGESLKCRVPLIVSKKDMQGYGSAVTYARRYGLMSMAGIAPDDDDGNAAAKSTPASNQRQEKPRPITAEQFQALKAKAELAGTSEQKIADAYKVESLHLLLACDYDSAIKRLDATIAAKKPSDSVAEDEIPY